MQGDFSGHGQILLHRPSGEFADQSRVDGATGRRAVLGGGTFRKMNVNILVFGEIVRKRKALTVGAQAGKRDLCRLLHDGSQISGAFDVSRAGHGNRFHPKQFTAGFRPGQSVDHALQRFVVDVFGQNFLVSEIALYVFVSDPLGILTVLHNVSGRFSADAGNTAFQIPHPRLVGVPGDDGIQGLVGNLKLLGGDAVPFSLTGNQVVLGDLYLFFGCVGGKLNDLHPVDQRARHRVQRVGGGDEYAVGEIKGQFHKMIAEGLILFTVQHLQHGGGRIPPAVGGHFVQLVQKNQGIHGFRLGQSVDDPAGHRGHIGFPVTADLCFIPHAAKGNPHIFPVQSLGKRSRHRGFANTGRPNKT